MKITYEAGDVVALKSGGPCMTIKSCSEDGMVDCVWFDTDNDSTINSALFHVETLNFIE